MENLKKKEVRKILLSFKNLKITFNEAYNALNLMVEKLEKEPQIIYRDNPKILKEEGDDTRFEGLLSGHFKDSQPTPYTTSTRRKPKDEDDYGSSIGGHFGREY